VTGEGPVRGTPSAAAPLDRRDALVVGGLALGTAILGWPVLGGGVATYLDNPVHLAEIEELALHHAWSDIAFGGFPLGVLHSPLWYRPLALLRSVGLPAEVSYAWALWLAALAPPVALYLVGRPHAPRALAAALAFVLLWQPAAVAGIASPFGGMWTHSLALAALIGLAGLALWPRGPIRSLALTSTVGLIALTHVFAIVPSALVIGASALAGGRPRLRDAAEDLAACALGVCLGTFYWGTLLASVTMVVPGQHLSAGALVEALLGVTDFVTLVSGGSGGLTAARALGSAPSWVLLGAGLYGATRPAAPAVSRVAGVLSLVMFALLVFVHFTGAPLLGPLSWRQIPFVHACAALAALGAGAAKAAWRPWSPSRVAIALGIAAGVGACGVWSSQLRDEVPPADAAELREVHEVWAWLREHHAASWRRVLVQDTFLSRNAPNAGRLPTLYWSHVMARTAGETGVRQVGAYYGLVPYATFPMTFSDGGVLMGLPAGPDNPHGADRDTRLAEFDVSHVVTCSVASRLEFSAAPGMRLLASIGRFSIFARETLDVDPWVDVGSSVRDARATLEDGRIHVEGDVLRSEGTLRLASAFHPFFRVDGAPGATLRTSERGLMLVRDLPAGPLHADLVYEPPWWPSAVTGLAALAWLVGLALVVRRGGTPSERH
jgi:hypothetical protein